MDFFKTLLMDLSTGLSKNDIMIICFQFFISIILAYLVNIIINRKSELTSYLFLLPVLCGTTAGILAKTGIQGALVALTIMLYVVKFNKFNPNENKALLIMVPAAILCGYSQLIIALVYIILSVMFLKFTGNK